MPDRRREWPSDEKIIEMASRLGSQRKIAEEIGRSRTGLRDHMARSDLLVKVNRAIAEHHEASDKRRRRVWMEAEMSDAQDEEAFAVEVRKLIGGKVPRSVEEIADQLNQPPRVVRAALAALRDKGYRVPEHMPESGEKILLQKFVPERANLHKSLLQGDEMTVGVISDTHFGSKELALDQLELAYDAFVERDITEVWHAGDLVAGIDIYRGQHQDLVAHTFEDQVALARDHYPRREGITTRVIAGNHDIEGLAGKLGANPVAAVANQRDDIDNLGDWGASIELPNQAFVRLVHGRGGGSYALCHDDETEVFTDQGWMLFAELDGDELLATRGMDGEVEFQEPISHTREWYEGPMFQFGGGRTSSVDMLVTPNHRMLAVRPWRKHESACLVPAEDFRKGREWAIVRNADWGGINLDTIEIANRIYPATAFMRLLGWYISEGSCNPANNQIQIAQHSGAHQDEIFATVQECGFRPAIYSGKRVCWSDRELADWLKPLGHSHEKHVPDLIKSLSPSLLREFLDAYWKGDGHLRADGRMTHATTTSCKLADDLQEIAMRCGINATIKKKAGIVGRSISGGAPTLTARDQYVISLQHERSAVTVWDPPEQVPYEGEVFCAQVPNGTLLTRRNGRVAWSGNSYKPQKWIESLPPGRKPAAVIFGHWHISGFFRHRYVPLFLAGCFEWQTSLLLRLGLQPDVGFWIVTFRLGDDGSLVKITPEWFSFYPGRIVE